MDNLIVIAIVLLIVGGACAYIYREKKNGRHCIGCPHSGSCASAKNGGCGCGCSGKEKE